MVASGFSLFFFCDGFSVDCLQEKTCSPGMEQSAEIVIREREGKPGKQKCPGCPSTLPMTVCGSLMGNDNLLLFPGERIDDLVHDRFAAVLEPKAEDDGNCRTKTDTNTPCNRCHERVDDSEIELQLRERKDNRYKIQKDPEQDQN